MDIALVMLIGLLLVILIPCWMVTACNCVNLRLNLQDRQYCLRALLELTVLIVVFFMLLDWIC